MITADPSEPVLATTESHRVRPRYDRLSGRGRDLAHQPPGISLTGTREAPASATSPPAAAGPAGHSSDRNRPGNGLSSPGLREKPEHEVSRSMRGIPKRAEVGLATGWIGHARVALATVVASGRLDCRWQASREAKDQRTVASSMAVTRACSSELFSPLKGTSRRRSRTRPRPELSSSVRCRAST